MSERNDAIRIRFKESGPVWELAALEASPCTLACPTRINVRGYVSLVADGRFAEALDLIRQRNPFPGVCGRICPRPCEAVCVRGKYDESIAICSLKRFVSDIEMRRGMDYDFPRGKSRKQLVAIVGAGPAGLSAAVALLRLGYQVTIFDAEERPGGMMNLIPSFRLPGDTVRRECKAILSSGARFVGGVRFGEDITWKLLKRRGFEALLLACGAGKPKERWKPQAPRSVIHALEILEASGCAERSKSEKISKTVEGKRIVVSGTGMMALDSARAALRLGASRVVEIVGCRRELAAFHRDDLAYAEKEGVAFEFLSKAKRLESRHGKMSSVVCVRLCESEPDSTGRREAFEKKDSEFSIEADLLIDAEAREVDFKTLGKELSFEKTPAGTVAIESETYFAGKPGVFAAGDMVTGPRSVVEAIASGEKAAYAIHRYLSGESLVSPLDLTPDKSLSKREFSLQSVPEKTLERTKMQTEKSKERKRDFREVEKGFHAQQARREAQRCLRCGPCSECTVCVDICEKKDFILELSEERSLDIHAGREFWSSSPDSVVVEAGVHSLEAKVLRTLVQVNEELCVGCGRCSEICAYRAVQVEPRAESSFIARVDEIACKGCGNCVSVCPTGALDQINFEKSTISKKLETISPRSKVLFICRWARPAVMDLPRDVVVIESMCIGRLEPRFVVEAAMRGSRRIMIAGCLEHECHYGFGRAAGHAVVERSREILRIFGFGPKVLSEVSTDPAEFSIALDRWAWRSK